MKTLDITIRRRQSGFSLIELLAAMGILSVILLVLAESLSASLRQFSETTDRSNHLSEGAGALEWLQKDLQSTIVDRPANIAVIQGINEVESPFFDEKVFFPIEINRQTGLSNLVRSFENGQAPPRLPGEVGFSQLAFVSQPANDSGFLPKRDHLRFKSSTSAVTPSTQSRGALNSPAIVGYYVAFTKDTPFRHDSRSSMKLFRHYRPGGNSGLGYADGFLNHTSHAINQKMHRLEVKSSGNSNSSTLASVRSGRFQNRDQPFLLDGFLRNPFESLEIEFSTPKPWPDMSNETEAPNSLDRGTWSQWQDPNSGIHERIFPDKPVAYNVIRFECVPYRIHVDQKSGEVAVLDAAALNELLNLKQTEWPCLIAPDFVDITLGLVDEDFSVNYPNKQDWLVDWSITGSNTSRRRMIERNLTLHKSRIFLNSNW